MKTILDGTSRRVGAIFNEIDTNFIEVCSSLLRIAYPTYTLKGYAITQPVAPFEGDCYLVNETGTVWDIECEKDNVLYYNGMEFEVLPYKITEINQILQALYFTASQITIDPIEELDATTVQGSLAIITAALIAKGLMYYVGSMSVGSTFTVA